MTTTLRRVLALLVLMTLAGTASADPLPQPQGEVILTLTGALTQTNADGAAQFDLAILDALAQRTTVVETPWYEGPQEFTGPTIATLMAAVGASGSGLRFVALNDYASEMPWADIDGTPVILATRHNGAEMSVRDKGPLFVIYPFDEMPALRNEVYFSRSAWQVASIEVLP